MQAGLVQSILRAAWEAWGCGSQGFLGVGALYSLILQLIPFLPSNIPHALEILSTGGLFSDGGHIYIA